jgi:hypothetical protein
VLAIEPGGLHGKDGSTEGRKERKIRYLAKYE